MEGKSLGPHMAISVNKGQSRRLAKHAGMGGVREKTNQLRMLNTATKICFRGSVFANLTVNNKIKFYILKICI
ncbi:MAG: hypothetical protein COA99_06585 [Moraxellaceae bacterium]|nr:MAG: hypothetical protein COA99_06585 [Moraxellaceae bacterium]